MLVLYNKSETNFNTLGYGVLRDLKTDAFTTEVLNGVYNLEFTYIKEGWLSEYLVEGNIIKADGQLFRIRNVKKNIKDSSINVFAKHIWFDNELNNWLEDVAPTNKVGHAALSWVLDHAKETNKFTINGDCTIVSSARYVRMNPIEAIYNADNALLQVFGGEIELNNFNVFLHNRRGSNTGIQIRQDKNLSGAEYNVDLSTIATRIMPVGRDGLLLPEKYIDSPLINNYYAPFYYKLELDIGVDEDNNITLNDCYTKMRAEANNLFSKAIDKPNVTISIDFVELSKTKEYSIYSSLETAHLGDSCIVHIPGLNIDVTTRIVKIIKNCNKNIITNIELGTPKIDYVTNNNNNQTIIKNTISKLPNSVLAEAQQNATNLINHPFNGYIYISEDTGELYIMNTSDPSTATKVWKFGLGGLGYSSTGINGPYTIAITQNGQIVADFIATGTLNASVIQGLNTVNNGLYIDNYGSVTLNSATMNNAEITGGNIELVDTGTGSDPSIMIYNGDNIVYRPTPISEGTNMNGMKLLFSFANNMEPNWTGASISNVQLVTFTNGSIRYNYGYQYSDMINIWFHNDLTNEDVSLFEKEGEYYDNPGEPTINLSSLQLPSNIGTITYINTGYKDFANNNVPITSYIKYEARDPIYYKTQFTSDGAFITKEGVSASYSSNGMQINDQRGTRKFTSDGILWMTPYGQNYKDFIVNATDGVLYSGEYLIRSTNVYKASIINSGTNYLELLLDSPVGGTSTYGVSIWASDKRLKKNIKDSNINALDLVNKIRHISFKMKESPNTIPNGYLADQLQDLDNNLVFEVGEEKIKQPNESYLIPLLSKAIQELSKKLEIQEQQIKSITEKLNNISKK